MGVQKTEYALSVFVLQKMMTVYSENASQKTHQPDLCSLVKVKIWECPGICGKTPPERLDGWADGRRSWLVDHKLKDQTAQLARVMGVGRHQQQHCQRRMYSILLKKIVSWFLCTRENVIHLCAFHTELLYYWSSRWRCLRECWL